MPRRPRAEAPLWRGIPAARHPRGEAGAPAETPPVPSRAFYRPASPMTSAAERQGRSRDGSTST